MNRQLALETFLIGGIEALNINGPVGISLTNLFHAVLDIATGEDLTRCLAYHPLYLSRICLAVNGLSWLEADSDYRARGKTYSVEYDGMGILQVSLIENSEGCAHSWKQYQGFTDSYDYCTKCDEKKRCT